MKLLIDMNLSPRWVNRLAAGGIQSAHWSDLGSANAPDTGIMAYARTGDYVVLTHDLDFGAILAATGGKKPSVVQIRAGNVDPDTVGSAVVEAPRQTTSDLENGALLNVDTRHLRLRLLPLRK